MTIHLRSLHDWNELCRQDAAPVCAPDAGWLTIVLERHEDAEQLVKLLLARHGRGRWRLVLVV